MLLLPKKRNLVTRKMHDFFEDFFVKRVVFLTKVCILVRVIVNSMFTIRKPK